MNQDTREKFENLMGTALSKKINADMSTAANRLLNVLLDTCTTAATNRSSLMADEIAVDHIKPDERAQLLVYLDDIYKDLTLCTLIRMAASLSMTLGDKMSHFVGHSAKHFEELHEGVTFNVINRVLGHVEAEHIHHHAQEQTGKDN